MLVARKATETCQACRLHLFAIFRHGFTQPAPTTTIRYSNRLYSRRHFTRARHVSICRMISTSRTLADKVPQNAPATEGQTPADIEAVVRQAKKTFGETLPKNYLSSEEYKIYQRLYGPPLRETRADDLFEVDEVAEKEQPRNVMLRENEDGEVEEIEYDPSLGFEVTSDCPEDVVNPDELFAEAMANDPNDILESDETDSGRELEGDLAEDVEEDIEQNTEEFMADDLDEHVEHRESESDPEDSSALKNVEPSLESHGVIQAQARNQREYEALMRLQKDMEDSITSRPPPRQHNEEEDPAEEYEEIEEEEQENEEDEDPPDMYANAEALRIHPHTIAARSVTRPSTLVLPDESLIKPITEALDRTNIKHLQATVEKELGGKHLPYSPSTPSSGKLLPQKPIGLDPSQRRMSEIEADTYLAGVLPPTYATVTSTLVEVRKRLGQNWLRGLMQRGENEGARVLDVGGGGAGIGAWREIVQAEWNVMKDEGTVTEDVPPNGKATVLTAPDTLRHRISRFLENTTFLPRLPDYLHTTDNQDLMDGVSSQQRKVFDIIIAPHTLWPLKEEHRRKSMVQNLWKMLEPNGGILILIEKGLPRGFEAIAGARSLLLNHYISSPGSRVVETETQSKMDPMDKGTGMIIAPCTNHLGCPMYPIAGVSNGRKDFCHFIQRYHRPQFLQRLIGASAFNHEDIQYSYLAVRKGIDARQSEPALMQGEAATRQALAGYEDIDVPEQGAGQDQILQQGSTTDIKFNPLSLPRLILSPLKRRGHVTLDLCTPSGTLERWTVPKSFSKVAYHDARKTKWGDLWALGAKTRVPRKPRLGSKADQRMEKEAMLMKKKGKKGRGQGVMGNKADRDVRKLEGLVGVGRYVGKPERRAEKQTRKKRRKGGQEEELYE